MGELKDSASRTPNGAAIVAVEDLVKRYRKGKTNAVDGISFAVRPGEFFALLGPNGAGKTTTISILTTTLIPTAGRVRIAGYDVVTQASAVRRKVGIIFQNPSLDMNLTGEENVRFHAVLYGLYPYRPQYRLMPLAYRRQVEELAALLNSLMHRPDVLFLDEPTPRARHEWTQESLAVPARRAGRGHHRLFDHALSGGSRRRR